MTPKYSIVTYATHSHGMFPELDVEKHGIVVGGWNKPWKNFMDKLRFYHRVASQAPPDHIVICIDAFDTRIAKAPRVAVRRFIEEFPECRFLISKDPLLMPPLASSRVFDCTEDCISTGLFMGYASDVARILADCLKIDDATDDQRAMQQVLASKKHNICVDAEQRIFCNLTYQDRIMKKAECDAVFIGYPGMLEPARIQRMAHEYLPFLYREVMALAIGIGLGLTYAFCAGKRGRSSPAARLSRIVLCLVVFGMLARHRSGFLTLVAITILSAVLVVDVTLLGRAWAAS